MTNTILNHRTVRKYKPDEIPESILNEILEAGIRGSNTGNMQAYSIIVTTNQDLKNKLWELHFKQDMVKQAPVVMTFCSDFNRFNKWCVQNKAIPGYDNFLSFYTASVDAVIAAQNVAVCAESKGLGICYLGTTNYTADKIIKLLELPQNVMPVTTLVVGYPDENPLLTDRLPAAAVIHNETYQDFSEENIKKLYDKRDNSEETKKIIKENSTETLAQVFTKYRYTKENNVNFSKIFIDTLKNQLFMNHEK